MDKREWINDRINDFVIWMVKGFGALTGVVLAIRLMQALGVLPPAD